MSTPETSALLASTRPTVAAIGALAFNTDLATKLRGLKKSIKATTVRQEYRGTGSQSFRRQIWVRVDRLPAASPICGSTRSRRSWAESARSLVSRRFPTASARSTRSTI